MRPMDQLSVQLRSWRCSQKVKFVRLTDQFEGEPPCSGIDIQVSAMANTIFIGDSLIGQVLCGLLASRGLANRICEDRGECRHALIKHWSGMPRFIHDYQFIWQFGASNRTVDLINCSDSSTATVFYHVGPWYQAYNLSFESYRNDFVRMRHVFVDWAQQNKGRIVYMLTHVAQHWYSFDTYENMHMRGCSTHCPESTWENTGPLKRLSADRHPKHSQVHVVDFFGITSTMNHVDVKCDCTHICNTIALWYSLQRAISHTERSGSTNNFFR